MNPLSIPGRAPSPPQQTQHAVAQSSVLFQGNQEIVIRHDGQDYRLRITRQNKLILTK